MNLAYKTANWTRKRGMWQLEWEQIHADRQNDYCTTLAAHVLRVYSQPLKFI